MPEEVITLGGGCFWCLEAVFDRMEGVTSVESGYMGGLVANPSYKQVCTGRTGHAEVVRVAFDPSVTSLRDVLAVFFAVHDPTTLNRQGNDVGTQYRSAIFYESAEHAETAREVIAEVNASKLWPEPVVTEVAPAGDFWVAEDYHQEYFANNAVQPYCQLVVAPKVRKFMDKFAPKVKQLR
jgi:peptide-methionine (S)-S-oxide reductase